MSAFQDEVVNITKLKLNTHTQLSQLQKPEIRFPEEWLLDKLKNIKF